MTWFGRKEIVVCPGAGWDVDTEMVDMDVDMELLFFPAPIPEEGAGKNKSS